MAKEVRVNNTPNSNDGRPHSTALQAANQTDDCKNRREVGMTSLAVSQNSGSCVLGLLQQTPDNAKSNDGT
jgi:hypothetical protein